MIDSLAFLPVHMVEEGMAFLRSKCFEHLEELLHYFYTNYVTGRRRHGRNVHPLYPPSVWNAFEATIKDESRTNNICEYWNNSFKSLIGFNHNHPSIWFAIDSIRKDVAFVQHHINELSSGARSRKGVKQEFVKLQEKLKILCNNLQDC